MHVGLLVLRVVVGLLFAGHGAQKLFGWFGGHGLAATGEAFGGMGLRPPRAMALAAGLSELVAGLLFALGLLTAVAAFLLIAVMGMAVLMVHWRHGPWVTEGGYEYSVVLMAAAFCVTAVGPGRYSLDNAFNIDLAGLDWACAALGLGLLAALALAGLARVQERGAAGPRAAGA
jgi:putative oxidoreductase